MEFCVAVAVVDPPAQHGPRIAEYGIPCLEVTWQRFPHWDTEACKRMRQALAREGLSVHSVHAPFGGEINILDSDAGARLHAIQAHLSVLRGGAELGAKILVMHPGREYQSDRPLHELVNLCIEAVAQVAYEAAKLGMLVALENVLPAHALHSHAVLRQVVETVAHPTVGLCLDTGHANVVDSVPKALNAFAGRINHVHLHDNNGEADEHLLPGLGAIDWAGFVDQLMHTGYSGPLTLECHPPNGMPPGDILPYVRRALGIAD